MLRKLFRNLTAFLPVTASRQGACKQCGACCRLPYKCPFLGCDGEGKTYCRIYRFRPPSCKKYPRTPAECMTGDSCGFSFKNES